MTSQPEMTLRTQGVMGSSPGSTSRLGSLLMPEKVEGGLCCVLACLLWPLPEVEGTSADAAARGAPCDCHLASLLIVCSAPRMTQ
jgi:hypothetical protein